MPEFTPTQGRYLAFIHAYVNLHGRPPAESEIAMAMCVSAPSVNQMVKKLEKEGLILRRPGQARSLQILIPEEEIPAWGNAAKAATGEPRVAMPQKPRKAVAPAANLYVLTVRLTSGPISEKFAKGEISRAIEIRGDQTLEQLHQEIFKAFDRSDEHLYEFQFGKRPFDPAGPNYGVPETGEGGGDATATTLDELGLTTGRVFGYWFDFGDDWLHQVQLDKIENAIPTVRYPRTIKRVGKSPPQYADDL